ncbi:hypothetical protein QOU69_14485 [Burkholderia pseudomallei]|uniref:hypothetical protein n=1 Tax=Burkholderia pseudomallei TaxID=28450 RepID=UPI0021F76EED|nr:hypothetical protein [Burkholderia pseudomallei]MCW0090578.1 hypothetical protein [Burkholderia pseudomallei]MCW0122559.1 hypothetical protein [Burkholderia pseudomallei]MDK2567921.1 hypothetical protein [Burkholderia pseudomallei]MDK2576101.1 hypothetical protein [Burkholderia pseudomallei]
MEKSSVLSDLIERIALQKKVITDGADQAWLKCDLNKSEPEIVKSFILDVDRGVHYLNECVSNKFNASQSEFVLKFAGVFSHQRPYVSRLRTNYSAKAGSNLTEQCELSDMAFLAVLVDHAKTVLGARATFFQAKKENKIDNQTQRWLYDYDDKFDYKSTAFWERTETGKPGRTLPDWDEERSSAFQYLILPPGQPKPTVRLSPWSVNHPHSFGFFLYRLLAFSDGKNYVSGDAANGAWSSIVNDMLRMGKGAMKGVNRGSQDLDTIVDYFNDFRGHEIYSYEGSPDGIPFVLAIMQDTRKQLGP